MMTPRERAEACAPKCSVCNGAGYEDSGDRCRSCDAEGRVFRGIGIVEAQIQAAVGEALSHDAVKLLQEIARADGQREERERCAGIADRQAGSRLLNVADTATRIAAIIQGYTLP